VSGKAVARAEMVKIVRVTKTMYYVKPR
jgi:hypothetical protein